MITKLLVANRGEITRRIFRTCKDLGIATVAVYSKPDHDAPFVREADEAVPLGGATPAESYLRGAAVVAAALAAGADAVHPGYGFLSENAQFAGECLAAGLVFVGPPVEAIALMGSKLEARTMMEAASVPVLPGRDLTGLEANATLAAADEVGWPILVKASFGGGGRGMRVVRQKDALLEAVDSARREASSAFGDDTVFLERYVDNPRHVEIQVFGDQHGKVVHLNERECSIQRRHQKIIEEAPSPAVDAALRARMGDAAVQAAEAIGYVGAGTVEFLLAPGGEFFFLEVNTRLQVEHPVTEMVTGLDLVQLQLLVAEGDPLPSEVENVSISGHAIEVRVYAEDPAADFLPAGGTLSRFYVPPVEGVRVDSGVEDGDVVSPNYDPMLAKVIAHGRNRAEAIRRLRGALRGAQVHGVVTNLPLLIGILGEEEFQQGRIDTHYLERHAPAELMASPDASHEQGLGALAAALAAQVQHRCSATVLGTLPTGWRNSAHGLHRRSYTAGSRTVTVGYQLGREVRFEIDGERADVELLGASPEGVDLVTAGLRRRFSVSQVGDAVYVDSPRASLAFQIVPRFPDPADDVARGSLLAPMPGTVVRIAAQPGDRVATGDTLLVLEAMKMEHQVVAPAAGQVRTLPVTVGQTVDTGQLLAVFEDPEVQA